MDDWIDSLAPAYSLEEDGEPSTNATFRSIANPLFRNGDVVQVVGRNVVHLRSRRQVGRTDRKLTSHTENITLLNIEERMGEEIDLSKQGIPRVSEATFFNCEDREACIVIHSLQGKPFNLAYVSRRLSLGIKPLPAAALSSLELVTSTGMSTPSSVATRKCARWVNGRRRRRASLRTHQEKRMLMKSTPPPPSPCCTI